MKKYVLLTIAIITSTSFMYSQNLEQNLKKYWYYRERLKSDFMVVDNNNAQGTNLPASSRYEKDGEVILGWGDSEGFLGQYIMVLATEYRLLKDNEKDYSETLQELKNALNAFERLDKYAEYWWRDPHSSLANNADVNGFFIRDDVGSDDQSISFILNHPNSQLAQSGVTKIESDFINADDGGHPCEMSKDQVWSMLPALALVEKLVDEPGYIIQDALGANVTFREWARKITHRVITHCQSPTCSWFIWNPVVPQLVRRGYDVHEQGALYEWPFHFGFAGAGNSITHQIGYASLHSGSSSSNGTDFREAARFQANHNPKKFYSFGSLMSIMEGESSWAGLGTWGDEFTYYEFLRHVMIDVHWYEQLRLIRGLLHESPDISYDDQNARQTYMDLLNSAPECGPYKYQYTVFDNGFYWYFYWANKDWSSNNRLIWPERLGVNNGFSGFYNGLDYMLLHNLFCLTYENFIETVEVGDLFPLVQSTDIISSNTIPANFPVFYIADRKVQLKPGFHAESSCYFNAHISSLSSNFSYQKISYQPQCNYNIPGPPQTPSQIVTVSGSSTLTGDSTLTDSTNCSKKSTALETYSDNGIMIYPNPGKGKFIIESKNPVEELNSIEIVNTLGQKVYSYPEINKSKVTVDISTHPKGIYFVKISTGNQIYNKQIIVQ